MCRKKPPGAQERTTEAQGEAASTQDQPTGAKVPVDLEHVLGAKPGPSPEEMEFVVTMQGSWTDARRIGRDEGRTEGRAEEAARNLLTVFRVRGVTVPDTVRERILAEKDPARIERWHEQAILAASASEVLDS